MTSTTSPTQGASRASLDARRHSFDLSPDRPNRHLRHILVAGDALAVALAWGVPSAFTGSAVPAHLSELSVPAVASAIGILAGLTVATLAVIATQHLYLSRVCSMRTMELSRISRVAFVVGLTAIIVGKFFGEAHLARVPVLIGASTLILLNVWRVAYAIWLSSARRAGKYTRSVILVGGNEEAFDLDEHLRRHPQLGYRIRGVVGPKHDVASHEFSAPWIGDIADLPRLLETTGIKGAIVAGGAISRRQLNWTIRQLLEQQVHVHMSTGINGIDHRRLQSHALAFEPMVYVERAHFEPWQLALKRALDVTIASVVLVLTAPVIVVAALVVKATDRGPMFFQQERIGRHGEPFRILKLRSMCIDAEKKLIDLRDSNVRQGPLFKLAVDPRVTNVGRILRATSIDELPQLINVIRGHMSLVGPRPALPSEVAEFDDALLARQNVMPGITGLWQVEARDNPDFTYYQRLDLFYVENWSVALDLSILAGTVRVVVVRAWVALARARARRSLNAQATRLDVLS